MQAEEYRSWLKVEMKHVLRALEVQKREVRSHTLTHTHTHAYVHMHAYTYTCAYTHTRAHIHMHAFTQNMYIEHIHMCRIIVYL
jgi:hypothetical protein